MLLVTCVTYHDFIHRYATAPNAVAYLRNAHRHLLKIEVSVEVFHEDREIEFYMMKDLVDIELANHQFNHTASCENVASFIMGVITESYGNQRKRIVKVQEDNNGYATLIKEANE